MMVWNGEKIFQYSECGSSDMDRGKYHAVNSNSSNDGQRGTVKRVMGS